MTFPTLDAILLAMAFLLPGFVWDCVLQMFLWRRENRADRAWIRFLTLSALNCGLWAWLIYLLLARVEGLARPWVAAFAWSFILFVSPAVLGAVTGFLSQARDRQTAPCALRISHGPACPNRVGSRLQPVDGILGTRDPRGRLHRRWCIRGSLLRLAGPGGARSLSPAAVPCRGRRAMATRPDEQRCLDSRTGDPNHRVPRVSVVRSTRRDCYELTHSTRS